MMKNSLEITQLISQHQSINLRLRKMHKGYKYKHWEGFTLVELSIVLIIISLIIAGITAGSSLIKTAEINSVLTDFRLYQTAYNNFVGRYAQPPGDYNDAANTWAAFQNTPACNGNNDGAIGTTVLPQVEVQNAMYELSASNIITAAITAPPVGCNNFNFSAASVAAAYLPSSKVSGGLYSLINSAAL